MFTDSSAYYDLIYSFKDYEKESIQILKLIEKLVPNAKSILDIGCGTSEHHLHLNQHFVIDGIDINEKFIEISKSKFPNNNYFLASMLDFDINKKYDVILCLFSSIGYLNSLEETTMTLRNFSKHLNPNGVIIVDPWISKDDWSQKGNMILTHETETTTVCRMSSSYREGDFSYLLFDYLIGENGNKVQHYTETHKMLLSSVDEMKSCFHKAGLTVEYNERGLIGRGLYVAKNS